MKNIILTAILTLFSVTCFGHSSGDLKFLGIPINGTETQFVSQLRLKGFSYDSVRESYRGQFNGTNVDVYIHTNHNLVDRVYVAFPFTTERDIRIEFNRLLRQFNDNSKYLALDLNSEISEKEDISYEMAANNKRYQASFSYFNPERDKVEFAYALIDKFNDYFTDEQLAKLKEYCKNAIGLPESEQDLLMAQILAEIQATGEGTSETGQPEGENKFMFLFTILERMRSLADGEVWFMIHESDDRFRIGLYYDNLHNQAHGEDL